MAVAEDDPTLKLLQERGVQHELAHLSSLQGTGRAVGWMPSHGSLEERVRLTVEAMRSAGTLRRFTDSGHRVARLDDGNQCRRRGEPSRAGRSALALLIGGQAQKLLRHRMDASEICRRIVIAAAFARRQSKSTVREV